MRSRMNLHAATFLVGIAVVLLLTMNVDFAKVTGFNNLNGKESPIADKLYIPAPAAAERAISAQDVLSAEPSRRKQTDKQGEPENPPEPTSQPSQKPPELVSQPSQIPKAAQKEELGEHYTVTAYFLNVRANPNKMSKIVKVVEKGSVLDVAGKTENGWLRLSGEGYVHGSYAELVERKGKETAPVKILSFEPVRPTPAVLIANDASAAEPVKPSSRIDSVSGLTESHIARMLEGTELAGHELENAILDIEEQFGINAYFTIAVMKLESGNGSSRLARNKNNLFGLNAIDGDAYNKAYRFDTKADCVLKFGQLIAEKYMDKGFTTVDRVARKYCPANGRWPGLIKNIMKRDYRKL